MSKLPYTFLFIGPRHTVAIAGPHIQVFESQTGRLAHSTAANAEGKNRAIKSGHVRCAAIDGASLHVVTVGDDKVLRVWEADGLRVVNESEVPKKPTLVKVTADGQTILVSDKFGDVMSYPLHLAQEGPIDAPEASTKKKPSTSEKVPSGSLVMGHASLLTTFILTPDEKYIITADRDEHIRVSWYPEAYVIERYCLGHEKFVSAIHIPPWDPALLVSGGGDPALKIWDWISGTVVRELGIAEVVMPFVKVARRRAKGRPDDADGEGSHEAGSNSRQRRKAKKANKKAKAADEREGGGDDMAVDAAPSRDEPGIPILVLHRIDTYESAQDRLLVFHAVGATALFYCPFPTSTSPAPEIQHVDLGKPVHDVVRGPDGELWVLLDAQWGEGDGGAAETQPHMVRVLKYAAGKFVESGESSRGELLAALNTSLLPATPPELASLDLYSWLAVMPKNLDAEHNAMERDGADGADERAGRKLSAKEMGRLKRKQALLAKSASSGVGEAGLEEEDGDKGGKKARSESVSEDGMKLDA